MLEKSRENRVRRMAARQGYILRKSPRRDPNAPDYGTWQLCDAETGKIIKVAQGISPKARGFGLELEEIERYLTER